jgi:hypothetical protein
MSNLFKSAKYKEKKRDMEKYFIKQNLKYTEPLIEFNGYTLEISHYKTKDNVLYTSDYTRGIIKNGNEVIADIKRNYYDFPYLFIEHQNGKLYLLCAEDHKGYTIINLTDKTITTYIPDVLSLGAGLSWEKIIEYNKYSNKLTVVGSINGFLDEIIIYDFSTPDSIPLFIATKCENFSYF